MERSPAVGVADSTPTARPHPPRSGSSAWFQRCEVAMLTGAHRAVDSEPNVVGIHWVYKRNDSSHFYVVPDPSRIYTPSPTGHSRRIGMPIWHTSKVETSGSDYARSSSSSPAMIPQASDHRRTAVLKSELCTCSSARQVKLADKKIVLGLLAIR